MNDHEKAVTAAVTLKDFFQQFGGPNEKFSVDLLSILLEELFNAKVISLLSEPLQERGENRDNLSVGDANQFSSGESRIPPITSTMEDGGGQNPER